MKLFDKVENRIYKGNIGVHVEYHSGGFFVRKQVLYVIFLESQKIIVLRREEGLHPNDNDYQNLYTSVLKNTWGEVFALFESSENVNILEIFNGRNKIKIMPSIFLENIEGGKLTEIVIDGLDEQANVLSFVYEATKHKPSGKDVVQ